MTGIPTHRLLWCNGGQAWTGFSSQIITDVRDCGASAVRPRAAGTTRSRLRACAPARISRPCRTRTHLEDFHRAS